MPPLRTGCQVIADRRFRVGSGHTAIRFGMFDSTDNVQIINMGLAMFIALCSIIIVSIKSASLVNDMALKRAKRVSLAPAGTDSVSGPVRLIPLEALPVPCPRFRAPGG